MKNCEKRSILIDFFFGKNARRFFFSGRRRADFFFGGGTARLWRGRGAAAFKEFVFDKLFFARGGKLKNARGWARLAGLILVVGRIGSPRDPPPTLKRLSS